MTLSPAAQRAASMHARGRAAQACRAFAAVLAQEPASGEVCRLYGLALRAAGQTQAAVEQLKLAVMMDRDMASMTALAETLHLSGALEEARQCFEAMLLRMPDSLEVMRGLAAVCVDLQQDDSAASLLERVLAQAPEDAVALTLFGKVGLRQGFVEAARTALLKAVPFVVDEPDALCRLADLLCQVEQEEDGLLLYDRALALSPRFLPALGNRGAALLALGRPREALLTLRKANGLQANVLPVVQLLTQAYRNLGDAQQAAHYCAEALRLQPGGRNARAHQATLMLDQGRIDEALTAVRTLRADFPEDAELERFEALLLLLRGEFAEGWKKLDSRLRFGISARIALPVAPEWQGERLDGKRVLISTEEGFGDMLQFLRYAELLAAQGAVVGVRAPIALHRLLGGVAGISAVHAELRKPDEPYDFDIKLLSLPRLFNTILETIPSKTPYIAVDVADIETWRARLTETAGEGLRVGLVWAGNPKHGNDHNRSIAWEKLRALTAVAGVTFYSLQVGAGREAFCQDPCGVLDVSPALSDYYETACAICALDLLITVDTSVAHLAGALGRPVWTLLPLAPDWRWLMERRDSPWYPSMRLFRQRAFGDWDRVIATVTEALRER